MPMEGWLKFLSPQNTSGVSGVNIVAAESNTTEDIMDLSSDLKKQQEKTHNMPPYCSCGVIQVSASPDIHTRLETRSFTPCFNPKSPPEDAKLKDVCISDGHWMHLVGRYQWTLGWHHMSSIETCCVFSSFFLLLFLQHCLPLKLQ